MKDDEEAEDPGPMPQLEDMNPYLSGLRAQLEAADKEVGGRCCFYPPQPCKTTHSDSATGGKLPSVPLPYPH